jgi:hypothetical protein
VVQIGSSLGQAGRMRLFGDHAALWLDRANYSVLIIYLIGRSHHVDLIHGPMAPRPVLHCMGPRSRWTGGASAVLTGLLVTMELLGMYLWRLAAPPDEEA